MRCFRGGYKHSISDDINRVLNSQYVPMIESTYLATAFTVEDYRRLEKEQNKQEIIRFIHKRFKERYITPLRGDRSEKHGFCTMAICCLMIETLESFRHGWGDTRGKSKKAFDEFFKWCKENKLELGVFDPKDFYKGVRCGILHQGETTNGWRIRRKGPLYDPSAKIINATAFHNELENALKRYLSALEESDWESKIWQNLRRKMKHVIANCQRDATQGV